MPKIAILYICTGRYVYFWKIFFPHAEKYLFPGIKKNYFVFTDNNIEFSNISHVIRIEQTQLDWPHITLKRFHIFSKIAKILENYDYIFFINANMIPQKIIGSEILPTINDGLLVTSHPGFFNKIPTEYPYERNPISTAYIPFDQGKHYVCGGFNGGWAKNYLDMIKKLKNNIEKDERNGAIALWHDESHLNNYILNHSYKLLDPSYAYPEGWQLPFDKKILILDKSLHGGHDYLRGLAETPLSKASKFYNIKKFLKKYFYK